MGAQFQAQKGGFAGGLFKFILLLIILGIGAAIAGWVFLENRLEAPGPLSEDRLVWVEPGSGLNRIAAKLEAEGFASSALFVKAGAYKRSLQSSLRAGEYEIPAAASVNDILDILAGGKTYLHQITIPEGLTTKMILVLIEENEILEGSITLDPAEGTLLPETWSFPRGETRDGLIRHLQAEQTELIDRLWPDRQDGLPFDTKEDAIILASIVEKETGITAERERVAAVFVNRLKRGMRLESDPTIIYGLTGGEPLGRGIRLSELRGETPYNTYIIRGLPPTPIANPGREAIAAVLNPADTNEIFFVADGTGGHAFAETLAQHQKNVRKWREIERQRQGG